MNRPSVFLGTFLALSLLVLSGCDAYDHQDSDHDHAGDHGAHTPNTGNDDHKNHDDHHGHGDPDEPSVAVTHFTDFTELFVEFPILSVGNESPFAAHLTWLDTFRPVTEGRRGPVIGGS